MEGGTSSKLFTGQVWDNYWGYSGLYYYGARYYNPEIMRFTQADPMIQNFYEPQQLNRYSYVTNNPLKYNDPSGNFIQIPVGVLMYVSALVSSPDFSMDAAWIGSSVMSGDYEGAAYGAVGLAIPGVLAAEAGPAGKLLRKGQGEKIGGKIDDLLKGSKAERLIKESGDPSQFLKKYNKGANLNSGKTVLGSGEEYIQMAQKEGANYLDVGSENWKVLEGSGKAWDVNKQFLDEAIDRGDEIRFATDPYSKQAGYYFKKEVEYLREKGYTILEDKAVKTTT